jgi:hypothetical protein
MERPVTRADILTLAVFALFAAAFGLASLWLPGGAW